MLEALVTHMHSRGWEIRVTEKKSQGSTTLIKYFQDQW